MSEKSSNVVSLQAKKAEREPLPDTRLQSGAYQWRNSETWENVTADIKPGYQWRFNNRANQLEVRELYGGLNWHPAADAFISHLAEEIEKKYWHKSPINTNARPLHFGADVLGQVLQALAYRLDVDPFKYWLEGLKPWDEIARIDGLLQGFFGADDDRLTRWASAHIFIGAVWRAFQPGCLIRETPILIGPEDIGKSALLRNLFPQEEQPHWFSDSYAMHELNAQQRIESTLGAVVVELSEMNGLRKAELERVKGDLTRTTDKTRFPYARSVSDLPRRFTFCGTSNSETVLPNDPGGNSRFVPIHCPRNVVPIEKAMDDMREQLWAEALHKYHAGVMPNLPRDMKPDQQQAAEMFRDRDHIIEDELPNLMQKLIKPSLNTIMERLNLQVKPAEEKRVTTELKRLGYKPQRTKSGRFWAKSEG